MMNAPPRRGIHSQGFERLLLTRDCTALSMVRSPEVRILRGSKTIRATSVAATPDVAGPCQERPGTGPSG